MPNLPGAVYCPRCKTMYYIKENCPCDNKTKPKEKPKENKWAKMSEGFAKVLAG